MNKVKRDRLLLYTGSIGFLACALLFAGPLRRHLTSTPMTHVTETPCEMTNFYRDNDGDGFGAGTFDYFCDKPEGIPGYVKNNDDCKDDNSNIYPGAPERCNNRDDDCDLQYDEDLPDCDADGDGYTPEQGDCNPADPYIHPGASELCNGMDDDCDGQKDEGVWYWDADGDGFGDKLRQGPCDDQRGHFVKNGRDCNDYDSTINPEALEVTDGVDNNCDGKIDRK